MSYQFDHRQLAEEMQIFAFDENVGPGLPLWLPNGVAIRDELESMAKALERLAGYQRVMSPHVALEGLYRKSGHLEHFAESMFPPMQWPEDKKSYYLRPMNCPHHHQIFASKPRSYRELPLRLAEYGQVYRFEPSGSLRGLSRVRGLCQNDAHIYFAPKDARAELERVLQLHVDCYANLGLQGFRLRLSKKAENLEAQIDAVAFAEWLAAEQILRDVLNSHEIPWFEAENEAAFYGPKIDVQMHMVASGGEETVATIQLDLFSAARFSLRYQDRDGSMVEPWIIHRAPLGSHERFVALLLEYFDGQLPGWMAPVQVLLLPVQEEQLAFCLQLQERLRAIGLRVNVDCSQGSLSKRIFFAHRERPLSKIFVGAKEIESQVFSLQLRDGKCAGSLEQLIPELQRRVRRPYE